MIRFKKILQSKGMTFNEIIKITFVLLLFARGMETKGQVLISLLLGDELNTGNIEFGLEGGFNWSTITNMETTSSLRTFNLGFYFDIKIDNPWSLYTGVLVKANQGVDELTEEDLNFS